MDDTYIANAMMVKVGRYFDESYKELIAKNLFKVIDESNIDYVDYIVVSTLFSDSILHQLDISTILMQYIGLTPRPSIRVESGESSGLSALEVGYTLIKSGKARSVLVIGVEKTTEYPTTTINENYRRILDYEVEVIRNITPPDYAAFIMKEYMKRYNASRDELTSWPIKMHDNAVKNPYAQLRFKVDKEKVLKSLTIAEPIKLLDTFPLGDGAAMVLLTSNDLLKNVASSTLRIVEVTSSTNLPFYMRDNILEFYGLKKAYNALRRNVKFDINETVIEIHDSYSIYAYIILEELKLATKGKSYATIDELSNVNLSGGLKARGHPFGATGLYQVTEIYKYLTSGLNGIKFNGKYGLVHSMSGPDYNSRLCLFEKVM